MLILALLFSLRIVPEPAGLEYRQPQLATGNGVVGVTFGAGTAVYFAASKDQGINFSKPVKVAEGSVLALGRHRGPRIAMVPGAIVISAVMGTKVATGPHAHGLPGDGNLTAWRSTDGGKTWSDGVTVNDVPSASREGLHAMVAGPDGNLFASWLDLRQQGTRLYGARSTDRGATWSKNILIYESPDGTICQCCHPSLTIDAKGEIYAMWRNVVAGNRDMYLARSTDGGKTFNTAEKQGAGTWPLNACPMDGGGVALDGQNVVTVWRRGSEVFLAPAHGSETLVEAGKDPAIAMGKDGVYAIWTGAQGVRARVPGKPEPLQLAPEGAFPGLVSLPGGKVLAAWEAKGTIVIQPVE